MLDETADVYSLGAILYELLTGEPPFTGATRAEILVKIFNDETAPPRAINAGMSRALDSICLKCLLAAC